MDMRFGITVVLFLAMLGSFVGNWIQAQNAMELKLKLEDAYDTIDTLKLDAEKQSQVLSERDARIDKLYNDKFKLSRQLQEAMIREREVREWAVTHIPDAVDRVLRGAAESDDTAASADPVQ